MAAPAPLAAADAAYARLRDLIVRGTLTPDVRVTEVELAGRLAVSRTPVREAMQRLLLEGLLVPAGGGARPRVAVAPLTPAIVRELYAVAGALEGVAARAVATLTPAARRALHSELRARERAFREATRERPLDYDRLFHCHDAVHRALMDACAGPLVRTLLESLRPQLDRCEWCYAPATGPSFAPTFAEHAAILRAVHDGDADAAERAVRANWLNGGARLAAAIDARAGDDGAPAIAGGAATDRFPA